MHVKILTEFTHMLFLFVRVEKRRFVVSVTPLPQHHSLYCSRDPLLKFKGNNMFTVK